MRKSDPMEVGGALPKNQGRLGRVGQACRNAHATLYISCQFLKSLPVRSMLMTFSTCASVSSQV